MLGCSLNFFHFLWAIHSIRPVTYNPCYRYTFLNTEEYEAILARLIDRLQEKEVGIRFDEFKDFCLFLNSLDDFQVCSSFLPGGGGPSARGTLFVDIELKVLPQYELLLLKRKSH